MSWTVLCISDDRSSLVLYQSILELDGYFVLVGSAADEALEVSKRRTVDCVVVDHEADGISVAREIAQARPECRILFVSESSETQFRVYAQVEMFITRNEAIEELSRCIQEMMQRSKHECVERHSESGRRTHVASRALHHAFVRWLLPW